METSVLDIYRKLKDSKVKFVDYAYLSSLTCITNRNSLYKIVARLIEKDILKTLVEGKYVVSDTRPMEFEIANYIYNPSYISFESALSYYGILSQFPYIITSATTKKSNEYEIFEKKYKYSQVKNQYFSNYKKVDGFLVASPEKAVFDSIYFSLKGLTSLNFKELDMSSVNKSILESMIFDTNDKDMINKFKDIL